MIGLSIKHLLGAPVGTAGDDTIDIAKPEGLFVLEEDGLASVAGPLQAKARILRVDDGFEVQLHDLTVTVGLECHTCLRTYEEHVHIAKTAEVFFGLPGAEDADFDVDVAKARLPLDEWLRQEILLALPIMQKCTREDCLMPKTEGGDTQQPFAHLKDMLS